MPYGAMKASKPSDLDHISPWAHVSTPSDVAMPSPSSNNAASPQAAPSPFSQAIESRNKMRRAYFFLEGKRSELMKAMNKSEQRYVKPPEWKLFH